MCCLQVYAVGGSNKLQGTGVWGFIKVQRPQAGKDVASTSKPGKTATDPFPDVKRVNRPEK